MKKTLALALLLASGLYASAQPSPTEQAQPIVEEGKRLYKMEMASWYGTDLFLERHKNREKIGGYFSYLDGALAKCIFFSRGETPVIIGTIAFDSTYQVKTAKADLTERPFMPVERDLYEIRKIALELIQTDTLFKVYTNTNLNLIPLIHKSEKKVYVLTGPEQSGVVIFGNDYLLRFNADNEIIEKKQLHKNIIPLYYSSEGESETKAVGAMHTHLPETGEFMTATDICTLMLYSKFTEWKTHHVVSEKYLNIWDCETNTLIVFPKDALESKDTGKDKKGKKKKKRE